MAGPPQYEVGGYAGKDSLKLARYYEPLGAWNYGRIEQSTFDQRPYAAER